MKNIWVPLSGQIAQQRKVETIANNIANANTTGFKRDQLVFKEHLTALNKGLEDIDVPLKEWSPKDFYRSQGAQNAYVKVDGSYTSFEQGQLQPTQNPLDFGLHGKGFFEVLTPHGIRFTRNGIFNLNEEGELVTTQGFRVLGAPQGEAANNDPKSRIITLDGKNKISVSREGTIYSKKGQIGKISVVEFHDIHALKKEGQSLFLNIDDKNLKREEVTTAVNQGFVEGSNVNAVKEMSELIQAHRHFQNITNAIQTYDAISGKAVNDISRLR